MFIYITMQHRKKSRVGQETSKGTDIREKNYNKGRGTEPEFEETAQALSDYPKCADP